MEFINQKEAFEVFQNKEPKDYPGLGNRIFY
jgi:hypothetical protein